MNLKTNTWHVWLWNYTYDSILPNNLCPYFWKILSAMLLFPINLILRIPTDIYNLFCSKRSKLEQGDGRTGMGIAFYVATFVVFFISLSLYNYWLWLFNAYSYNSFYATIGGFFILIGIFFLLRALWLKKDVGYHIKETATDNILVNFVSAKYNKYCPKINWK